MVFYFFIHLFFRDVQGGQFSQTLRFPEVANLSPVENPFGTWRIIPVDVSG